MEHAPSKRQLTALMVHWLLILHGVPVCQAGMASTVTLHSSILILQGALHLVERPVVGEALVTMIKGACVVMGTVVKSVIITQKGAQ